MQNRPGECKNGSKLTKYRDKSYSPGKPRTTMCLPSSTNKIQLSPSKDYPGLHITVREGHPVLPKSRCDSYPSIEVYMR